MIEIANIVVIAGSSFFLGYMVCFLRNRKKGKIPFKDGIR